PSHKGPAVLLGDRRGPLDAALALEPGRLVLVTEALEPPQAQAEAKHGQPVRRRQPDRGHGDDRALALSPPLWRWPAWGTTARPSRPWPARTPVDAPGVCRGCRRRGPRTPRGPGPCTRRCSRTSRSPPRPSSATLRRQAGPQSTGIVALRTGGRASADAQGAGRQAHELAVGLVVANPLGRLLPAEVAVALGLLRAPRPSRPHFLQVVDLVGDGRVPGRRRQQLVPQP